jgi:hypothetical protein
MYFFNILTSLASVLALTEYAAASLRITADHHSFGGVNFPELQFLEPAKRDEAIRAIVKADARIIRLFIRGDKTHSDPETSLGTFDKDLLDQFDDTLAAIHRISKGNVKVIIAPHDAHALRATNDLPCDAYCKKLDGAFLDFYSDQENREIYKNRLTEFFNNYKSKNFDGASWSTLNQVIMGVDLQNEPWSGIWPIVAGEAWLCEIATHLKEAVGLGANNIAVLTGGLSGAQMPGGTQNYPDSAFECDAVDVIAIHGYYSADAEKSSGTNWANMFIPGNTLTSWALGKKLLLVEEMSYIKSENGLHYKQAEIWDQGNALNYRGIPWVYSKATTGSEGTTTNVNVLLPDYSAIGALKDVLKRASTSRSNFDWSRYVPKPAALSNLTHLALNPFVPEQSDCTFGCSGWLCDAADGCNPSLICKNSICQKPTDQTLGTAGSACDNHKKLCRETLQCLNGECAECIARKSKPQKFDYPGSITGSCEPDSPFLRQPICTLCNPLTKTHCRGDPCHKASDCNANEQCDWGLCKPCSKGCLGMSCKSSKACVTGYCNTHGKCDYPLKPKKPLRPEDFVGRRGPGWNVPVQQRGPTRPRDNVMRVDIPK